MSTIDPGMEETVEQKANDLESNLYEKDDAAEEREEESEEDLREPSRWWFASTLCPLLAGTFGPIANGFSICALAYVWRVYIPTGGTEEHGVPIPDPAWELAINAISLLCALAGNASLLLNMTKRLKFSIAQPITIAGFLLAGVLLIADVAAINASPTYYLTGKNAPDAHHALSSAYYYAIFAAAFYMIIGGLMCLTVYGANQGLYDKQFHLTPSQRTLMIQTMMFIVYLLLGSLVFSHIEGWQYLNAVYWADVTILTVGFGDYTPTTTLARALLFPFAIGGILILGLVIGSIRSLVLERGREKMAARIVEKRRKSAIQNVDERKQTIKIGWLASADFSTDPSLSPAQRREEEFNVMRKVQDIADRERGWFSLGVSVLFALLLWLLGAFVFMHTEYTQQWTYFESVYFAYVALLTIGYGDFHPDSNSGRAFFVVWSLLAVPSLTILISNMGDTIVKYFSDFSIWIGSITVLPGDKGFRATAEGVLERISNLVSAGAKGFTAPGLLGDAPNGHRIQHAQRMSADEHEKRMMDQLAERLTSHLENEELAEAKSAEQQGDELQRDIHFYHYVLARELRNIQKDLNANPPKKYTWPEWEYYLKLMGNEDDPKDYPGQRHPDIMVPDELRIASSSGSEATVGVNGEVSKGVDKNSGANKDDNLDSDAEPMRRQSTLYETPYEFPAQSDGVVDRQTEVKEWKRLHESHKKLRPHPDRKSQRKSRRQLTSMDLLDWSWLSAKSPLLCMQSESEWILERLSAALERELNRQRKGYKRKPPISMSDIKRRKAEKQKNPTHSGTEGGGTDQGKATNEREGKEEEGFEKAARSAM